MLKETTDGCLATILIYHQLFEEMLRLLIRAQFLIQLAVFPSRIAFRDKRKQIFGQLQQELKDLVDFEGKSRFFGQGRANQRDSSGVVHKLTQRGSLAGLTREARRAKRLYYDAFIILRSST